MKFGHLILVGGVLFLIYKAGELNGRMECISKFANGEDDENDLLTITISKPSRKRKGS